MKRSESFSPDALLRYGRQGILFGLIAAAAVCFLTLSPDTLLHLRDIPPHAYLIPLPLLAGAWFFGGVRVWILSRAVGHALPLKQSVAISLSTEFAVAASPAGMGGPVVRIALLRREGIPVSTTASMIAADVAADILFFGTLAPIMVWLMYVDPSWSGITEQAAPSRLVVWLLAGLGLALVFAFLGWNGNWVRWIHAGSRHGVLVRRLRLGARARRLRGELHQSLLRSREVMRILMRERRKWLLANVAAASVQWLCRYGILPLIIWGLPWTRNPLPLFLLQGFLFTFSMLLVVPGGGGGVEVTAPFLLCYFVPASVVGLVVVLWRLCTYHFYLLVGGAVFVRTWGRTEDVKAI